MPLANAEKSKGYHYKNADAEEAVEDVADVQWAKEQQEEGVTGRGKLKSKFSALWRENQISWG